MFYEVESSYPALDVVFGMTALIKLAAWQIGHVAWGPQQILSSR